MGTTSLPSKSADNNAAAEPMMEMNMTPMIDVMLVLIIMFITTLPIAQNAVNLAMPSDGCRGDCPKPEVVRIDVDFDGTLMWNGEVMQRAQLEAKLDAIKSQVKQPEVQLYPHRLTSYKNVAAVLAAAQSRGVTSLGIIGNEQYL